MEEASESIDVEVRANSVGSDVLLLVQPSSHESTVHSKSTTTVDTKNTNSTTPPKSRDSKEKLRDKLISACAARDCGLLLGAQFRDDEDTEDLLEQQFVVVKKNGSTESTDNSIQVDNNNNSNMDTSSNEITASSDLSKGTKRTIWVVTTAALPWRTGTAVNPLWRAVYLAQDGHKVVLLIPWLEDVNSRKKLYGAQNYFPGGQGEQIEWIFTNFINKRNGPDFCCDLNLQIQFWNGKYQESFGSIFPVEDICSLIPNEEADVAILEEPEHLNWFRIIPASEKKNSTKKNLLLSPNNTRQEKSVDTESNVDDEEVSDDITLLYGCPTISKSSVVAAIDATKEVTKNLKQKLEDEENEDDVNVLGWACKFRYVIGILHTNYGDYIRQYGGLGTSFIGASALQALSSLVVRAYCHKVIRLSATLPSFWTITHNSHYKYPAGTTMEGLGEIMETTCNVHGVRTDFLDPPEAIENAPSDHPSLLAAPVYFIGKLIWAKGFEQLLEVQELFKTQTGDYFEIDVYGSGNDEKTIQRAFFGRHGASAITRGSSSVSNASNDSSSRPTSPDPTEAGEYVIIGKSDTLFTPSGSLRSQIDELILSASNSSEPNSSSPCNVQTPHTETTTDHQEPENADTSQQDDSNRGITTTVPLETPKESEKNEHTVDPINIISDVTQKTVGTGVETADAAMKMVESIIQIGLGAFTFGGDKNKNSKQQKTAPITGTTSVDSNSTSPQPTEPKNSEDDVSNKKQPQQKLQRTAIAATEQIGSIPFQLAPARARFKWRRNPIPARFLGVKDHIIVRDIPQTKIFLNMSTSEVLCTTSAEALAMGKFVILPKHPSNDFFMQFPNCLGYDSLEDCVAKLQYALANDPEPLNEQFRKVLSWEGATERLYEAAAITTNEASIRQKRNVKDISIKAAKFHVEASKKSHFVGNLFAPR